MSALWHCQRTVIRLALSCTTAVAGIAGCEARRGYDPPLSRVDQV